MKEKRKQLWTELTECGGLQRKNAARIVHEFLVRELKEPDELDGSPAYCLQDLFDCRVCAGHIIQVYVKGIMDEKTTAEGRRIFGTEELLSPEETEDIVSRVFDKPLRHLRTAAVHDVNAEAKEISAEKALELYQNTRGAFLADVRTWREYEEGHLKNAENLPLLSIMKNPYVVSERQDSLILLYCGEGYQSEAAARCLLEAGFTKVFYFAWKKE